MVGLRVSQKKKSVNTFNVANHDGLYSGIGKELVWTLVSKKYSKNDLLLYYKLLNDMHNL